MLLSLLVCQAELTGKCIHLADGDTITVLVEQREIKIRLAGIDAPEAKQPWGKKAKEHLASMVFQHEITVVSHGVDVNLAMVSSGCAWHYKRYDQTPEYAAAEIDAHESYRGLWRDPGPVAPWEWRKRKSK